MEEERLHWNSEHISTFYSFSVLKIRNSNCLLPLDDRQMMLITTRKVFGSKSESCILDCLLLTLVKNWLFYLLCNVSFAFNPARSYKDRKALHTFFALAISKLFFIYFISLLSNLEKLSTMASKQDNAVSVAMATLVSTCRYLTIIAQKCAWYRLMLSQRGRRQSWLKIRQYHASLSAINIVL